MAIGHFYAGIAAVIRSPETGRYLLLRRSNDKDFSPGVWECVTGRVDQGEGYEDALQREVLEELGIDLRIEYLLGTTHFFRGSPKAENELLGVIYLCSANESAPICLSSEHSEYRWISADQAIGLLSADDPSTLWARRVIERAEAIRKLLPDELVSFQAQAGFELG